MSSVHLIRNDRFSMKEWKPPWARETVHLYASCFYDNVFDELQITICVHSGSKDWVMRLHYCYVNRLVDSCFSFLGTLSQLKEIVSLFSIWLQPIRAVFITKKSKSPWKRQNWSYWLVHEPLPQAREVFWSSSMWIIWRRLYVSG